MATAYTADTYSDVQLGAPWAAAQTFIRPFSFNIGTNTTNAGFALNDTVKLCPIPYKEAGYGVLVVGYHVEIPALDTGTSVRVSLGDTDGASNAFQATFSSAVQIGSGGSASVMSPLMNFNGTTSIAPVRGVVPKQYTAAAVYTAQGSTFPTIDFMFKVTTAPNTATTTGTIKGWLMLQTLMQSAVTF